MKETSGTMEMTIGWKRLIPLILGVVVYMCVGAVIFQHLEGSPELERRNELKNMIKRFIRKYISVLEFM